MLSSSYACVASVLGVTPETAPSQLGENKRTEKTGRDHTPPRERRLGTINGHPLLELLSFSPSAFLQTKWEIFENPENETFVRRYFTLLSFFPFISRFGLFRSAVLKLLGSISLLATTIFVLYVTVNWLVPPERADNQVRLCWLLEPVKTKCRT